MMKKVTGGNTFFRTHTPNNPAARIHTHTDKHTHTYITHYYLTWKPPNCRHILSFVTSESEREKSHER